MYVCSLSLFTYVAPVSAVSEHSWNTSELTLTAPLWGSKTQRLTDSSEVRWEICGIERTPEFWFIITIAEASMLQGPVYEVVTDCLCGHWGGNKICIKDNYVGHEGDITAEKSGIGTGYSQQCCGMFFIQVFKKVLINNSQEWVFWKIELACCLLHCGHASLVCYLVCCAILSSECISQLEW